MSMQYVFCKEILYQLMDYVKLGFIGNQSHHLIDEINTGNYTPVLYLRIAATPPKAIIS